MTSKRETVLQALLALITGAFPAPRFVDVKRGEVLPEELTSDGLVILRDGDPGEPEATLSPLTYHFEHIAEVELFARGKDGLREARFDDMAAKIGAAILADRTLGGLCDWVEADAPAPEDLPVPGADTIKAAVIRVTLHYSTSDPLN